MTRFCADTPIIEVDVNPMGQVQLNIFGQESGELLCGLHISSGDAQRLAAALLEAAFRTEGAADMIWGTQ